MFSFELYQKFVENQLRDFLKANPDIRGSTQRYDGEISPTFANNPHIDIYLWYDYGLPEHKGRPAYVASISDQRLAKLTVPELATLVTFADIFTHQNPDLQVVLSRFDAGLCVFVITDKAAKAT